MSYALGYIAGVLSVLAAMAFGRWLRRLDAATQDAARHTFADSVGVHPDDVDCDEHGVWFVRRGARNVVERFAPGFEPSGTVESPSDCAALRQLGGCPVDQNGGAPCQSKS